MKYYSLGSIEFEWVKTRKGSDETVFQLLSESYRDYVNELRVFSDKIQYEPLLYPEDNPDVEYVAIWIKNDGTSHFAGFFFYGTYPNAITQHDIYIGELYIMPEYRRNGIATAVFSAIVDNAKKHDMDISYFVLSKNTRAKRLYDQILIKNGYEERLQSANIKATVANMEECRLYYWINVG